MSARSQQPIDQILMDDNTLLQNIQNSTEAQTILDEEVGVHIDEVNALATERENVWNLHITAKDEKGDQVGATKELNQIKDDLTKNYKRHYRLAQNLFKSDPNALKTLALEGPRKRDQASLIEQIDAFYTNALANPEYASALARRRITDADLQAGKAALANLAIAEAKQEREKVQSVAATAARDKAFDAYNPKIIELRELIDIATEGRPELKGLLGIK